jgi:hypothetical protein
MLCVALASATPSGADPAGPVATASAALPTMTAKDRCGALQDIRNRLSKGYIFPAQVPEIVARLDCDDSRFQIGNPVEFARTVTEQLQAASGDSHLYLNFEPQWYAGATAPQDERSGSAENAAENQHARNFNFGLAEQKILPGNVRYLKLVGFFWSGSESAGAYDGAMQFLHDGRAIILDLRGNRGGDTAALYYLLSHFLKPGATITTVVTPGKPDDRVRAQTVATSSNLSGKPLYVLVSGRTRSAAEAVAYTVRQMKLGDIVGERTEGANHISDDTAIAPWFRLSVPESYTQDPVSKTNWEGEGVEPTIPIPSSDALGIAYQAALSRLLAATPDGEDRDFLLWARDGACAIQAPYFSSPSDLTPFAGIYGTARIEVRNGAAWLIREERGAIKLRPLCAGGFFEAEDDDTFRVKLVAGSLYVLRPGMKAQRQ